MAQRIVIYPSRRKALTLSVVALAFVALGVLFAVYQDELGLSDIIILIVSYIGVPLFAAGFGFLIYRALVPSPMLVIDSTGIMDNASAVGVGWLRWDEIERIVPYEVMGARSLGIVPMDAERVIARVKPLKQMMLRVNLKSGFPLVSIPGSILPMGVDALIAQLRQYGPAKEKLNNNDA